MAGLEAILGEPYSHTAIVLDDANVCRIPASLPGRLNSERPEVYTKLMQCWQHDLAMADFWICQFSSGSTEARVARLLLFLIEHGRLDHSAAIHLLSRQIMSGILGVAYESVCRVISHFRNVGVLHRASPGLYRCDVEALRKIGLG